MSLVLLFGSIQLLNGQNILEFPSPELHVEVDSLIELSYATDSLVAQSLLLRALAFAKKVECIDCQIDVYLELQDLHLTMDDEEFEFLNIAQSLSERTESKNDDIYIALSKADYYLVLDRNDLALELLLATLDVIPDTMYENRASAH